MDPAALTTTDEQLLRLYREALREQSDLSRLAPSIFCQRTTDVSSSGLGEDADVAGARQV